MAVQRLLLSVLRFRFGDAEALRCSRRAAGSAAAGRGRRRKFLVESKVKDPAGQQDPLPDASARKCCSSSWKTRPSARLMMQLKRMMPFSKQRSSSPAAAAVAAAAPAAAAVMRMDSGDEGPQEKGTGTTPAGQQWQQQQQQQWYAGRQQRP